eukprot:2556012-Rhodomonas_salina.3
MVLRSFSVYPGTRAGVGVPVPGYRQVRTAESVRYTSEQKRKTTSTKSVWPTDAPQEGHVTTGSARDAGVTLRWTPFQRQCNSPELLFAAENLSRFPDDLGLHCRSGY